MKKGLVPEFIWHRLQYELTELIHQKKHVAAFYNKESKTAFYI